MDKNKLNNILSRLRRLDKKQLLVLQAYMIELEKNLLATKKKRNI